MTARRSRLRRLVFPLYLLAVVVVLQVAVHRRYLRQITPATPFQHAPQPAGIDPLALSRIGYFAPLRRTSFANFPPAKPPGTIRIGCFGDSFTYGTEVLEGDEYAAVLADLLHAAGHGEVEVLDFGNPGQGFDQTYMTWDLVGRRYALDAAIVLALPRIWAIRDLSFTFWDPPARTLGFHARYVIDGDGLALIDVLGADEGARFEAYNRLVPPWRYLRFDRRPPAFLRAWLGPNRTIRNPFYYRHDSGVDEAFETYRRLVARFADAGIPILLWDADGVLPTSDQASASLAVRQPFREKTFLYLAPGDHFSRWGHRLLAEETAHVFGVDGSPLADVEVRDLDPPLRGSARDAPGAYREAAVALDGLPVARFFDYHRGSMMPGRLAGLPDDVRGLLAVPLPGKSIVDALFLPLRDGESAPEVRVRDGTRERAVPVTRLDDDGGRFRLFRVDLCTGLDDVLPAPAGVTCTVPPAFGMPPRGREVVVLVDGDEALRAAVTVTAPDPPALELRPVDRYFRIRADEHASALPNQLGEAGVVELVLDAPGGERARLALARWSRHDVPPPAAWSPLRRLLATQQPG